jgi:hypothetical protein
VKSAMAWLVYQGSAGFVLPYVGAW